MQYPAADIRRVLLSALDFSGDPEDAVKIGKVSRQARHVKRSVSRIARRGPIATAASRHLRTGATIATEIQDIEALKWTCAGVLSQAWPAAQTSLIEQAEFAAKAALTRLLKDGRLVESKVFEQELKDAMKTRCGGSRFLDGESRLGYLGRRTVGNRSARLVRAADIEWRCFAERRLGLWSFNQRRIFRDLCLPSGLLR